MPQIFHPGSNTIARLSLYGAPLILAGLLWLCLIMVRSSYGTGAGLVREQPVPFSHQHHVGVLGIDCRYCHTSVERGPNAGIPPTETCMNCHSQIWVGSQMLAPVRQSYQTNTPLHWHRVYNLPGFVYFDHSIHVHKGVGCSTCHGQVDEMPLMYQKPSLLMEWCLDCHRQPERNLRPVAEVFNMKWRPPANQDELGRELAKQYKLHDAHYLTTCTVCHR
jgi:Cytochrome c3